VIQQKRRGRERRRREKGRKEREEGRGGGHMKGGA